MKRAICRKILFLFLLIITPMVVNARVLNGDTNVSKSCQVADANLVDKYGLKFDVDGDEYTITMNPDSSIKNKKNIKFKISRIEGYRDVTYKTDPNNDKLSIPVMTDETQREGNENVINSEYIKSANKTLTNSNKKIELNEKKITSNVFVVILTPVDFSDSDLTSDCGEGTTFEIMLLAEVNMDSIIPVFDDGIVPITHDIQEFVGSSANKIDCTGFGSWTDKDSFRYKFCEASVKAKDQNNTSKEVSCSISNIDTTTNNDYYVNKDYFKITTRKNVELTPYKYNYTCDKTSTYSAGKCEIECEEVVTVEYGPPVASKAGFCFEYKVKVTSRVSCGSKIDIKEPEQGGTCTPTPVCTIPGSGVYHTQGGPNDDFDNCVVDCDGGVYSDRCSKKCYKKVYGKTIVKKTYGDEISFVDRLELLNDDTTAKVVKTAEGNPPLKYVCVGNQIFWDAGQDRNPDNRNIKRTTLDWDSRWHKTYKWGVGRSSYSLEQYDCISNTGIPRRCGCKETCTWNIGSCSYKKVDNKKVVWGYMNPGEAQAAYDENKKIYYDNIAKCKQQATCSTSQATFTISTNVGNEKFEFPINGKDTIKRENNTVTSTFTSPNTTVIKDSNIGCYTLDNNKVFTDLEYGVAWTFPGSYINNKTGEISYAVTNPSFWKFRKNKFCLPKSAPDVNQTWWNYYYTKYGKNTDVSYNSSEYDKNCKNNCTGFNSVEKLSDNDIKKLDWNITAHTENFGHNQWDITIKCFYAVNTDDLSLGKDAGKECQKACDQTDSAQKRVRSVDLSNLFPSSEGGEESRTPGFNWSSAADNTVKNPNYQSLPIKYAEKIQNKEKTGTVFNDSSELDYHFVLNRKTISEIKKEGKDYTAYPGNSITENVTHYKSEIVSKYADIHPENDSDLRCNNLKNRSCDKTLTG